jgi:hypothetical protein
MSRATRYATACVLIGCALQGAARAQQALPAELQATILARALAYDRSLKARSGGSVVIGVVFKPSDKESNDAQAAVLKAFKALGSQTIQGLPITAAAHPYKDPASLGDWLTKQGVDALYLTPGLSAELEPVRTVCREKKTITMSAVRSFVEQGAALGVVAHGDGARILVNMRAAESLGMELDSKLLQLSEVIR